MKKVLWLAGALAVFLACMPLALAGEVGAGGGTPIWEWTLAALAAFGGAGAIITWVVGRVLAGLNRKFGDNLWWKRFYSVIACGIQRAEKAYWDQPDGERGNQKLGLALSYASAAIMKANGGKPLTPREEQDLKAAVEIIRADLELKDELFPVDDDGDDGFDIPEDGGEEAPQAAK
jgi:hypothetical protein